MPRRPSGPLRELMYAKYAFIDAGIGAYRDAGPVSGNVPPILIVRAVIPVSDEADVALDAVTPSSTTSAAAKSTTFLIRTPPLEMVRCGARAYPAPTVFATS